jgi:hypothetical protein
MYQTFRYYIVIICFDEPEPPIFDLLWRLSTHSLLEQDGSNMNRKPVLRETTRLESNFFLFYSQKL